MANYIDVTASPYNATGNGVTDDTTAVQSAVNAAVAAKTTLFFPKGTYLVSSVITVGVGSNVTLQGSGATIRFASNTRAGMTLAAGSSEITVTGLFFQGDSSDDKTVNINAAIIIEDNVTDVDVAKCTFDHCNPIQSNDSHKSRRLRFARNYCHNCSGGVHPPSDSTIEDNDFICDAIVGGAHGRAQAIYVYGQFENISILNNRFKNIGEEDIQIRATNARFQQKQNFTIAGNSFENSSQYSIWIGSDDHPDIGSFTVSGNRFKNVSCAIMAQGARTAVIDGNHVEYDWEFPLTPAPSGFAIQVLGGIGLSGHFNSAQSIVVTNNKLMQRHPFVGKVTIGSVPANGDTLTVGDFTYTWKTTATADSELQINASLQICAQNLVDTLQARDSRTAAPCNVLRFATDVFNNYYAASYGDTDFNVVVIVSGDTFALTRTGTALTLTAPIDNRNSMGGGVLVDYALAPLIEANSIDDFVTGMSVAQNFSPTIRNNVFTTSNKFGGQLIGYGNVLSTYSGNRLYHYNLMTQGRPWNHATITDAFPVVEDLHVATQQLTTKSLLGRSGVIGIGDGKAYSYLWYGVEIVGPNDVTTLPYRWNDHDEITLYNGVTQTKFYFKRTSPGTGEFNTADGLIALINATGTWTAAYADYENDLGATPPKMMIKITAVTAGTGGNAHQLWVTRYKKPGDTSGAYERTPQPMLVGTILRDRHVGVDAEYALLQGGASTRTKTFVMSPVANPDRGVVAHGVDATSEALAPRVYQSDIVPGVGFTITHAAGSGSESFFFRVN